MVIYILPLLILLNPLISLLVPWKTYTNTDNNFTIKVPAHYETNDSYSDNDKGGWIGDKISFSGNFNGAQLDTFPVHHSDLIEVAGMKAFKRRIVPRTMGMSPSEEVLMYDFKQNGRRIYFSLHSIDKNENRNAFIGNNWRLNPIGVLIFERMLQTLEIH